MTEGPVRVRIVVWALALGLAALGIVLAIVARSGWPLIALLGLAVPLVPLPAPRRPSR